MTRPLPSWGRLALLPIGLAWAFGAEWTRLQGGWSIEWVVADLVPGAVLLIVGQVAWARRPDNRVGLLLVATAFAWYVGTYGASTDPRVGPVAHAFQGYFNAFLVWLVLAYPTGRLGSTAARIAVAVWFIVLAARSAFRLVLWPVSTDYDMTVPAEVDRYVRDISLRDAGDGIFLAMIAALSLIVLWLIVRRLMSETDLGRRIAAPLLAGGATVLIGLMIQVAARLSAGSFTERNVAWDVGHGLTVVSITLLALGFAFGVVRSRLARGSVADLVVELGDGPERPILRDVLARALHDPSLEVAYPVPGSGRFVDASGRSIELPTATVQNRAMTRLEGGGTTVAVLIHDPAVSDQPELVRSVAAATRMAIENERLAAEVRTQLEEVRASRARIVVAGDAERRRVERLLHDGAQQRLVTLALALQVARGQVDATDDELASSLDRAGRELELALAELRELARGLHPSVLTEEGLAVAVEALADRTPVPVTVRVPPDRFRPEVEATAYYVAAEALTNVVKYAKASAVTLNIEQRDDILEVEISDDGIGGADPVAGSGLRGLDDRVAAIGGRLAVTSEAGRGTTIRAEIPCA